MTIWTPALENQVRALYLDGRSYSAIARLTGLTKNQIAGKLDRLNLTNRTGPRASTEGKRAAATKMTGDWHDRVFEPYAAFKMRKKMERDEARNI